MMPGSLAFLTDPALVMVPFLVFVRIGAAVAFLPIFGEQSVPVRIRLALTLLLTAIILPAVAERFGAELQGAPMGLLAMMLPETISGLALGAVLRLFVIALQVAGSIAAQSTSLSQLAGNLGGEPMPAMGQILITGGLALAVISGLHLRMVEMLILSYEAFPPGQFPGPGLLAEWGSGITARIFALAFSLAAPFAIASLIYNIALGAINRAMPQLMVSFVGAPAITLGGLILLMLAAPHMLSVWQGAILHFAANPFAGAP